MRKEMIAALLVLLMLGAAAGGYMLMNNDGTGSETPDDEGEQIGEWDVYYVQSGSELPNCNSDTKGRLYYVAADAGFQTCTSSGGRRLSNLHQHRLVVRRPDRPGWASGR